MSLLVHLPLNGNLNNYGLSTVTITNNGATLSTSGGKIGGCCTFDGSNDFIQLTLLSNTTTSICLWLDMTNISSVLYFLGDSSGHGVRYSTSDGSFLIYTSTGNTITWPYTKVNTWIHLAITKQGTNYTLYVNGSKIGNTLSTSGDLNIAYLGRRTDGYYYNGKLNDFRVYDHCLSPAEVKKISLGLVLHYLCTDDHIENTTNLIGSSTWYTYWNNSGSATWNWNDTSIANSPGNLVYSISRTDSGNSCLGVSAYNLVSGKTYTASVYYYLSGTDGNTLYLRSGDTSVGTFTYNGTTDTSKWPTNKWIRPSVTITTTAAYNSTYFCIYLNGLFKRAMCNWQLEEKDHATAYTSSSRSNYPEYDASGLLNNGVNYGATFSSEKIKYAGSYKFTPGTYLRTAYPNPIKPEVITIMGWIKTPSTALLAIIACWESGGGAIYLDTVAHILMYTTNGYITTDGTTTLTTNTWHHICGTYDKTAFKIYVDGKLEGTTACTYALGYNSSTPWCIGRNPSGADGSSNDGSDIQNGYVSDIRIYATALSADDIKELYNLKLS